VRHGQQHLGPFLNAVVVLVLRPNKRRQQGAGGWLLLAR
jgi:hypothetical protein